MKKSDITNRIDSEIHKYLDIIEADQSELKEDLVLFDTSVRAGINLSDDLGFCCFVMCLEEEFNTKIQDYELKKENFKTVRNIYDFILKKVN